MILLIGALVLGFVVARLNLLPRFWQAGMAKVGSLALVLLLFSMGIALGADPGLMSSLPNLGMKALVLSLGSLFGSVALVWLVVQIRGGR